jgi:hypothetical protein
LYTLTPLLAHYVLAPQVNKKYTFVIFFGDYQCVPGYLVKGRWYKLLITVDLVAGNMQVFNRGQIFFGRAISDIDQIYSLSPSLGAHQIALFGDGNGACTQTVANVKLWNQVLTSEAYSVFYGNPAIPASPSMRHRYHKLIYSAILGLVLYRFPGSQLAYSRFWITCKSCL